MPTFLREYDKLARQCAAEGFDHIRFLLRLAELELIERERRMVERRCQRATESPQFWARKIPHFGGVGDQPLA
jgi:hypothetical protein